MAFKILVIILSLALFYQNVAQPQESCNDECPVEAETGEEGNFYFYNY
jgi:hypothetical protein